MINVSHHNCWYTDNKTTLLSYNNNLFVGLGTPLNVILTTFAGNSVVWFSVVFGQWNDNILLIGVDSSKANSMQKIKYIETSPIEKAMGTIQGFEEYQLSSDVQNIFGITLDPEINTYEIRHEEDVLYQISVHDECMCAIKPVNSVLLEKLTLCVLQEHSYFLNEDINWSKVVTWLSGKIDSDHLLVRSQLSHKCLLIRREGIGAWIKAKINPESYRLIKISNGKAIIKGTFQNS